MGAKPSTTNGTQSPRSRAFSTSSSSEVVAVPVGGGRLMRGLAGGGVEASRGRARSLSSVPDLAGGGANTAPGGGGGMVSDPGHAHSTAAQATPQRGDSASAREEGGAHAAAAAASLDALGRAVYAAHSLPTHIWSTINGIKCPVCNKFVLPNEIECHLVMCLTKPRLSYNEDILTDNKGECVICLEELCKGDVIARLPCLCVYHKNCIDQWFEVNRSCPEHPGD